MFSRGLDKGCEGGGMGCIRDGSHVNGECGWMVQ